MRRGEWFGRGGGCELGSVPAMRQGSGSRDGCTAESAFGGYVQRVGGAAAGRLGGWGMADWVVEGWAGCCASLARAAISAGWVSGSLPGRMGLDGEMFDVGRSAGTAAMVLAFAVPAVS